MNQSELPQPRRVPALSANDWMRQGWGQFKRSPLHWALVLLVFVLFYVLVSYLPGGQLLGACLQPLMLGAIMLGCHAGSREAYGFRVDAMKQAFDDSRLWPLVKLGLLGIAVQVLAILPLGLTLVNMMQSGAMAEPGAVSPAQALLLLAVTLPLLPAIMALWFAPALVAVGRLSPIAALRTSLTGCWRNPLGLSLHGLWMVLLLVLVALTYGLALFVAAPVMIASIYASFEDIFDLRRPAEADRERVLEA
jgi:uncharacterized membrane protein